MGRASLCYSTLAPDVSALRKPRATERSLPSAAPPPSWGPIRIGAMALLR